MSFLKFITSSSQDIPEAWKLDVDAAYHHASPGEKSAFLMSQAVMLNYFCRLCGGCDKLPIVVKEYRDRVVQWFLPDLKYIYYNTKESERDPYVKLAYLNIEVLLCLSKSKLNADECTKILLYGEGKAPMAIDATFYAPYIKFVEQTFGSSKEQASINAQSIEIATPVAIPSFRLAGRYLETSCETIFPSYQYNFKQIQSLASAIGFDSILAYFAGYNWRGINFSGVIGVLAAQCLEKDANAIPKGSNLLGYLDLYRKIVCQDQAVGQSNSLALSSDTTIQRRNIVSFLIYLRDAYGVLFDDSQLLANYIAGLDMNDGSTLHNFLTATSAKEVSVEMYNVFKNSCFGRFSELDVVYNGRNGRMDHVGLLDAKKTDEDDPDAKQDKSEDPEAQGDDDPKSKKKEDQDPEETAPGTTDSTGDDAEDTSIFNGPAGGDQDSPTTDADQNEDPAPEKKSNEEPDATEDPGDKPDEELKNPDESSAKDVQTDTHTTHTKFPAIPKLDDKRGVRLSLSEGETTNSVLYREELEAYIDSLLSNPPSSLSVQTIAAIKKLRANWLYLLSPKDCHDWLAAMIKLPKTITIKK